ncbi:hypothetical protein LTR15_003051 [Elasticomyces elasticus]|nr:hypothetical protein LTR15_003051 [Elasticomyces elasticus]
MTLTKSETSEDSMATGELRRSARLKSDDSNGRDHLASLMPGWTRTKLEGWITSPTVRPHLQLWYQLCVASPSRFNDGVDWVNTGYFYNPSDLEEDVLLMCLGEGHPVDNGEHKVSVFADKEVETTTWITQECWARTAWRIVHANGSLGQAFGTIVETSPAACYGFVVEILCVAFHSIAFRDRASCYERLINGHPCQPGRAIGAISDRPEAEQDTESVADTDSDESSDDTSDHSSDEDFQEPSRGRAPARKRVREPRVRYDRNSVGAGVVREWVRLFPKGETSPRVLRLHELRMEDEDGRPITGYRSAGAVSGGDWSEDRHRDVSLEW